jgi:hypothetical protein
MAAGRTALRRLRESRGGSSFPCGEIVDDENVAALERWHRLLQKLSPLVGPSITQGASMRS